MLFFLVFVYLSIPPISQELRIKNEIKKEDIVTVTTQNGEIHLSLEEYVIGVVAAEMPASYELEALKAQAVASRTFVYSRNLKVDDTVNSQVYQNNEKLKDKWKENHLEYYDKVKKAVHDTKGQVIVYEGEMIHAFFFASSNGSTNSSEDYWTTAYPYLVSVDSKYDNTKKDNSREKEITKNEMNQIFGVNVEDVEVIELYENNYVKKVKVNDKLYTGKEVRELCQLASSSFQIERTNDSFVFKTKGYGHGVGMSQYGAQGMAKEGYNYIEIIQHYYKDVEVVNK